MSRKAALKPLTASDLTLFEWHFRNHNAGNQKAINLNADVFVDDLFPDLPAEAAKTDGRIPLDLNIYGPGGSRVYNLQRKIIKLGEYKNWRLDGEFIFNPPDDPQRFDTLVPGDFAIFLFTGSPVPHACDAFFIASALPSDAGLFAACGSLLGEQRNRRMMRLYDEDLERLIETANLPTDHPANDLVLEQELEAAASGELEPARRLRRRRSGRRITRGDLQRAKQNADEVGRRGEEFVNDHLTRMKTAGTIADFEWTADANAVSPFDFMVRSTDATIAIDAKSTAGSFDRRFHLSLAELFEIADGERQYDIYRVYDIAGRRAKLRIVHDVRDFARSVLDSLKGLPGSVQIDGVSVLPEDFRFEPEIAIELIVDVEEEVDGRSDA